MEDDTRFVLSRILLFVVSFISFKQSKVFPALERIRNADKAIVSRQSNKGVYHASGQSKFLTKSPSQILFNTLALLTIVSI